MKILYCNPSFWDYRLSYIKRLNELFGHFSVIYSTKRYLGREKLLKRIPEVLGDRAIPYENEWMFDVSSRSFHGFTENGKQIPLPLGLLPRIWREKPDVLRTEGFFQWTPWVLLYAFLFRIPVFMGYERTLWTERNAGRLKTWHRKITDWMIRGYLVNGQETKKYLMSIGVKEQKIIVTGMSADGKGLKQGVDTFRQSDDCNQFAKLYKKEGGILYLFCGALIERKGVEPLLSAWKQHTEQYPQDTLVLVGGGELYEKITRLYGSLPSVFIEGRKEYTEVCKYYAIADVFVLPTIEDNWSLVIPEAMACGLPVATSIYNGCNPELVEESGNGYLFDTFCQTSLLSALEKFHHADLMSMGVRSMEIEKQYNTEACAQREYDGVMALMNV